MFLGGEGVDDTAHGVHLLGDVGGAAPFGAFEEQMFDEMGNTVSRRASWREPFSTQMPRLTERISGISSETMRMPLSRTVLANIGVQIDCSVLLSKLSD